MGHFQLSYSYMIFYQVCILLELSSDGAVKVVTVGNVLIIIIIVVVVVVVVVITLLQGINNYIPKTNHVSRVLNVAAVLWL